MDKIKTFNGVYVASIVPFNQDRTINEDELRRLIRYFRSTKGLKGIVPNAHAGEGATLTREERVRILRITLEEAGPLQVLSGVDAVSTAEVVAQAKDAADIGIDGLLVCPPPIFAWRVSENPEIAVAYHEAIRKAVDLPIVLFQYRSNSPYSYSPDVLLQLVKAIDTVVAVKVGEVDHVQYRKEYNMVKEIRPEISFLTASPGRLLSNATVGCEGMLTGYANIAAQEMVDLFTLVKDGDFIQARDMFNRLRPGIESLYTQPIVYFHTRYKVGATLAGRVDAGPVRPPQLPLSKEDFDRLKQGIDKSVIAM